MGKGDSGMMRITLGNQNMTVEPRHLINGEHADRTKGLRINVKHLALRHIAVQGRVRRALQAEQGDLPASDRALQRAEMCIRDRYTTNSY